MVVDQQAHGHLAKTYCNKELPLEVLRSAAGFYIGTRDDLGLPVSRESAEYWRKQEAAEHALSSGDWTQRQYP
ncbi:hypothetical protein JY96_21140 [Aquabacterium sp. NJ1]|uniref:hypothetical protein n=1 Tax=Aquabacterium sp. NJ1 TaxID=1538295 RepID=UPI00052D6416|nr:hypothetical protein [Aquabacterium sp. NJ1]KGM38687.1 hypothetical protein JY96_21140 [Aquabacterium sp. NJ1]